MMKTLSGWTFILAFYEVDSKISKRCFLQRFIIQRYFSPWEPPKNQDQNTYCPLDSCAMNVKGWSYCCNQRTLLTLDAWRRRKHLLPHVDTYLNKINLTYTNISHCFHHHYNCHHHGHNLRQHCCHCLSAIIFVVVVLVVAVIVVLVFVRNIVGSQSCHCCLCQLTFVFVLSPPQWRHNHRV